MEFGDEQPDSSPEGYFTSVPMDPGDDEGAWDFADTPSCSSSGGEQCRMVSSNTQELVSHAGLPAPDSRLDVLRLAECGLRDRLTLKELRRLLTNVRAEA